MICPYCNKELESHNIAYNTNLHIMYACEKMPQDGRIWIIPQKTLMIIHPSQIIEEELT